MDILGSQRPPHCLSYLEVQESTTRNDLAWALRPNKYYEFRHAFKGHEGRLDQTGNLPFIVLLLPLWNDLITHRNISPERRPE